MYSWDVFRGGGHVGAISRGDIQKLFLVRRCEEFSERYMFQVFQGGTCSRYFKEVHVLGISGRDMCEIFMGGTCEKYFQEYMWDIFLGGIREIYFCRAFCLGKINGNWFKEMRVLKLLFCKICSSQNSNSHSYPAADITGWWQKIISVSFMARTAHQRINVYQ